MRITAADGVAVIGLVALGAAVWVSLGWAGLLGYVGAWLIALGLVLAWHERG